MDDVKLGELLTRTQPHDLGFGRVQSERNLLRAIQQERLDPLEDDVRQSER